jgi:hypothetical protein
MKNDLNQAVIATASISEQLAAFAAGFDKQVIPDFVIRRTCFYVYEIFGEDQRA